jgi:hypothetical protein
MTSESSVRSALRKDRGRFPRFTRAYSRRRYAWLFATLILTLGAGPTLDVIVPRCNPLEILLALNLCAALATIAYEGRMRLPIILGVGFVVTRGSMALFGVPGMLAFSEFLWVTAVVLVMTAAIRRALRAGVVDTERILAALDAYILAGFMFGVGYRIVDQMWSGSFGAASPLGWGRSMYFSFVTIATLGYGDVVPVSEPARGLAIVEGMSGQMYLAVLVARLVSLYAQQHD